MIKIFGIFLLIFLCLRKTTKTVEFDTIPTEAIIVESSIMTSMVFLFLSSVVNVELVTLLNAISRILVLSMILVIRMRRSRKLLH